MTWTVSDFNSDVQSNGSEKNSELSEFVGSLLPHVLGAQVALSDLKVELLYCKMKQLIVDDTEERGPSTVHGHNAVALLIGGMTQRFGKGFGQPEFAYSRKSTSVHTLDGSRVDYQWSDYMVLHRGRDHIVREAHVKEVRKRKEGQLSHCGEQGLRRDATTHSVGHFVCQKKARYVHRARVKTLLDGNTARVRMALGVGAFVDERNWREGIASVPKIMLREEAAARALAQRQTAGIREVMLRTSGYDDCGRYHSDIMYGKDRVLKRELTTNLHRNGSIEI